MESTESFGGGRRTSGLMALWVVGAACAGELEGGGDERPGPADAAAALDAHVPESDGGADGLPGSRDAGPGSAEPDGGGVTGPTTMTADLGWGEGDDVTDRLRDVLAGMEPGEVLHLSHRYRLRPAQITIPEGVTLEAATGAGFVFIGLAGATVPYLMISAHVTLRNVSFVREGSPAGEDYVRTNNKRGLMTRSGATNVRVIDCLFDLDNKTHLYVDGIDGLWISGTEFTGGYYQLGINAPSSNIVIERSRFAQSFGDGIKTWKLGNMGVERVTIEDTVFEENWRDGIDTTGGFRHSVVRGSIFRDNGVSGLDIKSIYQSPEEFGPGRGNYDIQVEDCEFIDNNSGLVFTTTDRNTPHIMHELEDPYQYMPHDIDIRRCIFEQLSGDRRAFLFKDAHSIRWDQIQLLGGVREERTFGTYDIDTNGTGDRPELERTNFDLVGTNVSTGPSRGPSTRYPFDHVGPR